MKVNFLISAFIAASFFFCQISPYFGTLSEAFIHPIHIHLTFTLNLGRHIFSLHVS